MAQETYRVVVRLPAEVADSLKAIAAETGASLNSTIAAALAHAAAHPAAWRRDAAARGDLRVTRHQQD